MWAGGRMFDLVEGAEFSSLNAAEIVRSIDLPSVTTPDPRSTSANTTCTGASITLSPRHAIAPTISHWPRR